MFSFYIVNHCQPQRTHTGHDRLMIAASFIVSVSCLYLSLCSILCCSILCSCHRRLYSRHPYGTNKSPGQRTGPEYGFCQTHRSGNRISRQHILHCVGQRQPGNQQHDVADDDLIHMNREIIDRMQIKNPVIHEAKKLKMTLFPHNGRKFFCNNKSVWLPQPPHRHLTYFRQKTWSASHRQHTSP